MRLLTIGFTKSSARHFFDRLRRSSINRIIDVRLNNVSQLAGFAKKDDLKFFCEEICNVDYEHILELAPTAQMFNDYKKNKATWPNYADKFLKLMAQRKIENMSRARFDGACLVCSEDRPHHCHRRLVAEYLQSKWGGVQIEHL